MDGLMQLTDEEGRKLTDDEILDNIGSLVVGGYEATTLSMTWAFYYLAKFPTALQKLREENMSFQEKKNGEFITRDELAQLKYTNKVVEEAVRMANVAIFVLRQGDEDVVYQGYLIPKRWKVICWLRYLNTDPENFEDPMCFNPDRWDQSAKHYAFAAGTRSCVGNMLAKMQIGLFLHHLSIGYKWELINPDAETTYLPNAKPEDGVKITISKI